MRRADWQDSRAISSHREVADQTVGATLPFQNALCDGIGHPADRDHKRVAVGQVYDADQASASVTPGCHTWSVERWLTASVHPFATSPLRCNRRCAMIGKQSAKRL